MLRVNEIFVSVQGEGPGSGRVATFVRLSGCNLSCQWCDSKYALHTYMDLTVGALVDAILRTKVPYIVITGGEPLMQDEVGELLRVLSMSHLDIDVETNGTYSPYNVPGVRYVVSPKELKVANSWLHIGVPYVFKFVVGPETLQTTIQWVKEHSVRGAYFMPLTCNIKGKWECMVDEMTAMGRMVQSELIKHHVDGILCTRLQNLYRVR